MKLSLVRHGQAFFNIGIRDFPENGLTAIGILEVKKLAEQLKSEKFDAIYCSPTLRTKQTLEEILKGREEENFSINLSNLLLPKSKKMKLEKLKRRAEIFLQDLEAEHSSDKQILVISHQMVIRMILHKLGREDQKLEHGERVVVELA